jgi:hypothetical protein
LYTLSPLGTKSFLRPLHFSIGLQFLAHIQQTPFLILAGIFFLSCVPEGLGSREAKTVLVIPV